MGGMMQAPSRPESHATLKDCRKAVRFFALLGSFKLAELAIPMGAIDWLLRLFSIQPPAPKQVGWFLG